MVPGSQGMSVTPKNVENAQDNLARSGTAPALVVMTKFESLGHPWLRLADELESLEIVLTQLKKPERKASC